MNISDHQDGQQREVGTGVRHGVYHLPAWGYPYLLEGADHDGGVTGIIIVLY